MFDRALPEQVYFAPIDARLAESTIVQPDIVVMLSGIEANVKASRIEGPPSIVAEIISPSTNARDMVTKRNLCAQHGVPEYWLVDPFAGRVTIYSRPEDGKYQIE